MREAVSTRGIRVFVADTFEAHGTEAEVLTAFRLLERRGLVEVRVAVRCPSGHTIWDGPPRAVEHPLQCMECEDWTADDVEERNDHVRAVFKPEGGAPPAPPRENPFFPLLRQVGS